MADTRRFQGPGQWRSQAEPRHPDSVFGDLAEHYRRLSDKGETDAAEAIAEVTRLLKDGYIEDAVRLLQHAAALLGPESAAHADGLRAIAQDLPQGMDSGAVDEDPPGTDALS
jgi:hypothetical protein